MKRELLDTTNGYPEDYHDYVFKNGRLVGAFDEMYRHAKEVPWHQDKDSEDWYSEVGLVMLANRGPFDSILEMGCGLGYFSERLQKTVLGSKRTIHAFDISPEAIRKAREIHKEIEFWVDDVSKETYSPRQQYDLATIRHVFFFLLDDVATAVQNIARSIKPNGFAYVCQGFPPLDGPFVGKDILPNPDALIGFFAPHFELVHSMQCQEHQQRSNGPFIHLLLKRVE